MTNWFLEKPELKIRSMQTMISSPAPLVLKEKGTGIEVLIHLQISKFS